MRNVGKEFHPATILFVCVAAIFMIIILTNLSRFFTGIQLGSEKKGSSLIAAETETEEGAAEAEKYAENSDSTFQDADLRMINLTSYGVDGHNYYRLIDQDDDFGACISPSENLYRRTMKDSERAQDCEIENLCLLTFVGIHPGEAELEYYSCNDSILVGGRLPSYEELCEVYGEDSDTIRDMDSKLLARFRIVVDESGKITAMAEKL